MRTFAVVDTGGIAGEDEGLAGATARQARAAAEEADLVLFIVDGREGASTMDDDILEWLRKASRQRCWSSTRRWHDAEAALNEFARYGLKDVVAVSSAHRRASIRCSRRLRQVAGRGHFGELDSDPRVSASPSSAAQRRQIDTGQPAARRGADDRVGSAGTTRDSVAVDMERDGRLYRLIDTAGVRRKARVEEVVEKFSIIKTCRRSNIARSRW